MSVSVPFNKELPIASILNPYFYGNLTCGHLTTLKHHTVFNLTVGLWKLNWNTVFVGHKGSRCLLVLSIVGGWF